MKNTEIIDVPEDKIIDITPIVRPTTATDDIITQLEKLNANVTDKDGGEWINIPDHGICWKPSGDRMGQPLGVPSPTTPPTALVDLVKWGDTIDIDNIPQNSVVLIKLNVDDPMRVNIMQRIIAKQVLEPRIEKLKEKRVCILFMSADDDISIMTEADMESAGWEKKEKSRIITL